MSSSDILARHIALGKAHLNGEVKQNQALHKARLVCKDLTLNEREILINELRKWRSYKQ